MKYQNKTIFIFVLLIVLLSGSLLIPCEGSTNKKIKDALNLNEKMEISISGVYYRKEIVPKADEGLEITVNIEQLRILFLKKAVIISGEEMNYAFGYETVSILGVIKNNNKVYSFDYNLAGFGTIFITDKEFIQYGDMSLSISGQ